MYHSPLCHEGSWIYIWKDGEGSIERVPVKIPFGRVLILQADVWNGDIIGGTGNVRFHGGIIARMNQISTDKPVYGFGNLKIFFSGMEVISNFSEKDSKGLSNCVYLI